MNHDVLWCKKWVTDFIIEHSVMSDLVEVCDTVAINILFKETITERPIDWPYLIVLYRVCWRELHLWQIFCSLVYSDRQRNRMTLKPTPSLHWTFCWHPKFYKLVWNLNILSCNLCEPFFPTCSSNGIFLSFCLCLLTRP